jgi:hypothetical protein
MELGVGDVLTIRVNFRAGGARSSVVFKRDGSRAVLAKAGHATSTASRSAGAEQPRAVPAERRGQGHGGALGERCRAQPRAVPRPAGQPLPAGLSLPDLLDSSAVESSYPPFDAPLRPSPIDRDLALAERVMLPRGQRLRLPDHVVVQG